MPPPDVSKKKRLVNQKNRPDIKDDRPKGVLFSTEGSTGWRRRRDLGDYKGNKSEKNFDHLNDKFWGEGDESV
jgi:hypothetical protein